LTAFDIYGGMFKLDRVMTCSSEHDMKAFGQIPNSLFILQVIDEPVLRQPIEKQMDRIEHVHLGEYDFSAEKLRDSVGIRPPKLGVLKRKLFWTLSKLTKLNVQKGLARYPVILIVAGISFSLFR